MFGATCSRRARLNISYRFRIPSFSSSIRSTYSDNARLRTVFCVAPSIAWQKSINSLLAGSLRSYRDRAIRASQVVPVGATWYQIFLAGRVASWQTTCCAPKLSTASESGDIGNALENERTPNRCSRRISIRRLRRAARPGSESNRRERPCWERRITILPPGRSQTPRSPKRAGRSAMMSRSEVSVNYI